MREIFTFNGLDRKTLVFFGTVVLFIVLGPFGTYEVFSFWERVVYWTMIMVGVGFFMHVLVTVALTTLMLDKTGQVIRIIIGCILAGLPGAVVVFIVDRLMREIPLQADDLPLIWGQVTLIGIGISLVEYVDWGRKSNNEPSTIRTRFHERLGSDLGKIISLSMQDHYVEVSCENGTEMILIRMSDAIAELEGLAGMQTHRSHWVAMDSVRGVNRAGQKITVALSDGRSLPVSATYAEQIKAAVQPSLN